MDQTLFKQVNYTLGSLIEFISLRRQPQAHMARRVRVPLDICRRRSVHLRDVRRRMRLRKGEDSRRRVDEVARKRLIRSLSHDDEQRHAVDEDRRLLVRFVAVTCSAF
jgi:hypothetical protein